MAYSGPTQPVSFATRTNNSSVKARAVSRSINNSSQTRVSYGSFAGSVVDQSSWMETWSGQRASVGGSVKRSVTSSPTESASTSQSAPFGIMQASPQSVILGFNVPSSPAIPLPIKPVATRGGLSKALVPPSVEEELPLLSPVYRGLPVFHHNSNAVFFPDVDLTLLTQAQERSDVFKDEVVINAFMIAARAYNGRQREDKRSVLAHCMLAALTLADYGLDAHTVASGILSDILRLTEAGRSQLEEFMPSGVIHLVDRVTTINEISEIYRNHRDGMDDEKLRQMMLAMEDVKAVLVKLVCRMHELKSINGAWPAEEAHLLAQETLDIYSVVANRLGCWCIKAELEDLAFGILYPEECERVRSMVRSRQDPASLEATIQAIKTGLDEQGIKYEDISGRPKNLYGIWQKMQKDGVTNVDSIYDLIALRVVVSGNKHDCYYAQRTVQQLYRCMHERSKDFIKIIKKPNGYQSLHETIYGADNMPIEVQIRTHKMHFIAEYGFAAHWKYKENLDNNDEWMDKEVQYKKWLMNYKLGVHDKKVRPTGSPPTDSSLRSLGAHYLDVSAHPEHRSKVDPFLMHDRFKLEQPSKRMVRVMLQTQDTVEQRECSAEITAGELARELDVSSLPGYVMTVNQKLPSNDDVPLHDGDLVQVLPLSQLLSRSPSTGKELSLNTVQSGTLYVPVDWSGFQKRNSFASHEHEELEVFGLHNEGPVSLGWSKVPSSIPV